MSSTPAAFWQKLPKEKQRTLLTWAAKRARDDFEFFLKFVWTLDTAESDPDQKIKRFPQKKYLNLMARELQHGPKLIHVPKTRQMMMSWLHAAWLVWGLLTPGYYGYVQSKKEEDADDFIKDRVAFIWDHLPVWLRFVCMEGKGYQGTGKYKRFTAPNKSRVIGVPQGGDQFRGYVPTAIFLDEVAIWDQFEETITSIVPILQKGCRAVCVSTAKPGEWGDLVQSKIKGQKQKLMRGLTKWELEYGGHVLELFYNADPEKDTQEWFEEESSKCPGGPQGSLWQQEYEIAFDAYSGELIFPMFRDEKPFVCEDFDIPYHWDKWRGLDWGNRNETACVWLAYDPESKTYYVYREYYKPAKSIQHVKDVLAFQSGDELYRATWIDPAADRHDSRELDSIYYMLNLPPNPIRAWKADRDNDAGLHVMKQWLWNTEDPNSDGKRLVIFESCVNVRNEMKKYRFEDWATGAKERHNKKEAPRKKLDHAMNAIKYVANGLRSNLKPDKPKKKKRGRPPVGSLGWYRNLGKSRHRSVGGHNVVRQIK